MQKKREQFLFRLGVDFLDYVIEMLNIRKEFPGVVANDQINLQVKKGEIHALLGENGAGKSTLMNILFGLYQPDSGEIKVRKKATKISNPNVATQLGIGMVHQHFMLVHNFTITENIILGEEPSRFGKINMKDSVKKIQEISDRYKLQVDPYAKIEDITVGMQQRVEILKVLYRGADILIFDEPTAVLTPQEITELIHIMKQLIKEGKSIILITHKLKEIKAVSDRVTIIRDGKSIRTVETETITEDELAALMVGREVNFKVKKTLAKPKETVLKIEDLVVLDSRKVPQVRGVNLEVKKGEIMGLAGVDGNGQTELIEAITGLAKVKSGHIFLNGEEITHKKTRQITERGVGHIPQDRHKHGLVLDFTVGENMVLQTYYQKPYSRNGLLNHKVIADKAEQLIQEFDVRTPSQNIPIRSLSGGNQQKVVIAREIDRSPDLFIAAQPTRGLDVGAIEFIHRKLVEERDAGKAVLLVSLELEEIMNVSDRIAVIYEGKIVDIVDAATVDEQYLGLLMAGGKNS